MQCRRRRCRPRLTPIDLSVLIPVYNEVDNVAPAARGAGPRSCASVPLRYELIFVDDGSTDGTRGEARRRSRTPTPSTSASPSCGATAARPPRSRRRSTWRGGRSSCRWTATARTTRPTSPGSSSGSTRASTSSRAGGKTGRTRCLTRKVPSLDRQPAGRADLGRPAPRLRLHAEGVPPPRARRRAALRRDAPVHPDLRHLARGARHRDGRQPPRPGPPGGPSTASAGPSTSSST